ncbi:hypothetical protein BH23VER1_BH23VER1_19700 [soil metagenome]
MWLANPDLRFDDGWYGSERPMEMLTGGRREEPDLEIIGLRTRQHKAQRLQPWEPWTKRGAA